VSSGDALADALERAWRRAGMTPPGRVHDVVRTTRRRATYVILAVAFCARLGFVLTRPRDIEFPDGYRYTSIANDLLAGHGLKRDRAYAFIWLDAPEHRGTGYVAHFQPGYPVFLAGLQLAGLGSPAAVRLVQVVLGTLTVWFVMILARRTFDERCALAAGAVAACEPFLIFFTGLVLTETLATFLMTGALIFLVQGRPVGEGPPVHAYLRAAAWGAISGLSVFVRSMFLLFAPLVALFDVIVAGKGKRRARLAWHAVALLAFAAALAPWTIRNAVKLGAFVPASTRGGISVFAGFAPETTGGWNLEELSWPREELAPLGEVERDRLLFRRGLQHAFARPGRSLLLVFPKLGRLWSPVPWAQGYVSASYWAVGLLASVGLVGAAIAGMVLGRSGWRSWWPVLAPAAYLSLLATVFPGSLRFRIPAHAGLAVLAGAAYLALLDRLRSAGTPRDVDRPGA
jgi:4-amino-4-deoxy-L-arabinose transferase-like glycosyltransferase